MASFLFINQYYWPDEAATAQMLQDLAEDLARAGHAVTVLCGRSRYACHGKLKAESSIHERVKIERVRGTDWGRYSKAGRILDMFSFMFFAWLRLARLPRHDAVVVMTSPPLVGRLGRVFCRRFRVPLILWAQDVYPEIAEVLGALRGGPILWMARREARRIYRASLRIVVPGHDMIPSIERYAEARGKSRCIPNWADLERIPFGRVLENRVRQAHGWDRDRVLMYSGNLGVAHDFETILVLVALIQKELPSMRFVLVGDSPRHEIWTKRARNMGIHRVTRLPFQQRHALGGLLGAADAHLVSQKPETQGLLVPSKFYGIVAAGRPVILVGSRDSELGRQVLESQLGAVVEPGQAASGVRDALRTLRSAQDDPRQTEWIRAWAEGQASRQVRVREFQHLLEETLSC